MDTDTRLKKAIAARDKLAGEIQRIQGKKQAAEKSLKEVEEEIRGYNLDPSTLEETLVKLEKSLEDAITDFETKVTNANETLSPYMED